MKNIRWVIQKNLISENDYNVMSAVCEEAGIEHEGVEVIPFSPELPKFTLDEKTNIYYGSTTFMTNLYEQHNKPPGVFFDENTFSMDNYNKVWKEHMMNSEGKTTIFREFSLENHDEESLWFIRPDADDKSFAGEVRTFKDIKTFLDNVMKVDNVVLNEDTKIMVSPPYNITKEWRNYIVDGKVITSSLYRKNFKLNKSSTDIPEDMIRFVEDRCAEYMPHRNFAMDIALSGDGYYIIECGCLNSVGLYHCDVKKLVLAISKDISEKY